jgi:hypothetical protein
VAGTNLKRLLSLLLAEGDKAIANEDALDRWIREYASQMRARLRKGGRNRRQTDRFARDKSREALKGLRQQRPRRVDKDILVARYKPSPILDRLIPGRQNLWREIMRRRQKPRPYIISLERFSFLTNAEETLKAIRTIGEVEGRELKAVLNFDDAHCLDAGSFLVLAEIWPKLAPVFVGGRMARSIQKVLTATGVSDHTRMMMAAVNDNKHAGGRQADVWAFPLQRRRPALSSKSGTVHLDPQTRERATDRFCDAINEWLGVPEVDRELTSAGRGWLGQIFGELLCNAERHSQPHSDDGDWSTTAFMVRRTENGTPVLKCFIAFLSVGRSFAETLLEAAPEIRKRLHEYTDLHKNCGRSRETLATVFALQDTITCDPVAREIGSGGTGLQDVLEFVDILAGDGEAAKDARVTILSGRSCIELTKPYIPGVRRANHAPRLQWCNPANTSEEPPDEAVAYDLSEHFAGSLVSVAFTLDPEYLATTVESENDANDRS